MSEGPDPNIVHMGIVNLIINVKVNANLFSLELDKGTFHARVKTERMVPAVGLIRSVGKERGHLYETLPIRYGEIS